MEWRVGGCWLAIDWVLSTALPTLILSTRRECGCQTSSISCYAKQYNITTQINHLGLVCWYAWCFCCCCGETRGDEMR